jgi:hypothetical protein
LDEKEFFNMKRSSLILKKINLVLLCVFLLFASLLDSVAGAAPVNDIELMKVSVQQDDGSSAEVSVSDLTSLPPYQYIRLLFLSRNATSLTVSASTQLNGWLKNENITAVGGIGARASFTLTSEQSAVITVTGKFDGTDLSSTFEIKAKSGEIPRNESISIGTFASPTTETSISLTLKKGETERLYYAVTGGSGTNRIPAVFTLDENIVTVGQPTDSFVTITARGEGESDVTLMTKESGATAVCRVTVEPAAPVISENDSGGGGCDAGFGAGTLFFAMSLLAARTLGFSFRRRSRL